MSVGLALRQLGIKERLAYFHHIPFPSPDIFEKLPWREEILTALLHFDVLGFQTLRDRRNFADCLRQFVKAAEIRSEGDHLIVEETGSRTLVGAFPISIDFEEFAGGAAGETVAARAAEIVRSVGECRIILGVDRLDYTKGIPERLAAFRYLLKDHPGLHRKVTLVQIAVPSREDIPKYGELKAQIERLVSEINGHFSEPGWVPVHYIHRCIDRAELLAYYRAAHIALVTPLKDGMNLVSKEYCASRVNNDGVLILSEFAGAAFQLHRGALLVNPYHTRAVAEAIRTAFEMPLKNSASGCVNREPAFAAKIYFGGVIRSADCSTAWNKSSNRCQPWLSRLNQGCHFRRSPPVQLRFTAKWQPRECLNRSFRSRKSLTSFLASIAGFVCSIMARSRK